MIARIRFAFATLVSPWLMPLYALLETANLLQRGAPWRGEGMWTVEWLSIVLFLLGPVVCGASALDAARLSRPGNIHLSASGPSSSRVYLRAAGWCVLPAVAVHLLALVAALLVGRVTGPSAGWSAVAGQAVVQALVILWFSSVGSALGRLATPVVAGLVGAATGFVLFYVLGDGGGLQHFSLLALGSATVSRLGLAYNNEFVLAQGLLLVGTSALLLTLATRGVGSARLPAWRGVMALVLTVVAIATAPFMLPSTRIEARPVPPTLCTDHPLRICFFPEHERFAEDSRRSIAELVSAARSAGYTDLVPDSVMESSRTFDGGGSRVATFTLPLNATEPGGPTISDWAYELTTPTYCPQLRSRSGPPDAFYRQKQLLEVTWLHLVGVRSQLFDFVKDLRILTPTEASAVAERLRACDFSGDA